MRLAHAAIVAATLLLSGPGLSHTAQTPLNATSQVAENLPLLAPDLIWEQQLPGRRRAEPRDPHAPIAKELGGAIRALSAGWSETGDQTDWAGTPGLVTHLSPPGGAPRARRLTDPHADVTAVVDLSGDGQPEIVAAAQHGSGAILTLQVFSWDIDRVWPAFAYTGAQEPGLFGWFDAEGDGRRELWIDTGTERGLFSGATHGPFMRDRHLFRWQNGTYRQHARYRFATPFYHLNRYLYFASKGDWQSASRHAEPGSEIDRTLATELGPGPFDGGSDLPFVNGRMYFSKDRRDYFADFGLTGRLARLGAGGPGRLD